MFKKGQARPRPLASLLPICEPESHPVIAMIDDLSESKKHDT